MNGVVGISVKDFFMALSSLGSFVTPTWIIKLGSPTLWTCGRLCVEGGKPQMSPRGVVLQEEREIHTMKPG